MNYYCFVILCRKKGAQDYWRNLEKAINKAHPKFIPDGFIKYWEDHDKSHLDDSVRIMSLAEAKARKYICATLKASSENWDKEIPRNVYKAAATKQGTHKYDTGELKDIWEFFSMADLCDIILYGNNWSTLFEKAFTLPSEIKKPGGKKAKTEWMKTIDKLQSKVGRSNFNITKQEREMLLEVENIPLLKQ